MNRDIDNNTHDDDEEDTTSTLNEDESQQTDEDSNIRIYLRMKPSKKPSNFFSWDEETNMMQYDIPKDVAAGLINNSRTSYKFRFDSVIGMEAKQEEVFDRVGRPCVESALNGFNSTVFAYGQTGSGKTFTITGGAERYDDRGLIPRALSMIFERMRNNHEQIIAHVSYLEIYNNQGYDLLDPNHESTTSLEDLPRVAMLEDEDGNCHLRNLSMHPVTTEEDALNLLFLVGSEVVLRSKLHLVDLAGSERAHKTGAKGQLLREAAYINTSLHYLEMVIVALHEKNTKGRTHIPYRNSMMTSVLRDSLGGNCKTVMVATVSPEKNQTDESVSTCRFAQRVARVKNDARLNEEIDPAVMIRQLKARVACLEEEIAVLKGDVNEGAELKEYEMDKLRQKCLAFVNDMDPDAHLSMGEFTYTRMKACFEILKGMAKGTGESAASGCNSIGSSGVKLLSAGSGGNNLELEQRVHELEELVQQRDNEVAIMVNMIRKESGALIPAELQTRGFVKYTSNQDEPKDGMLRTKQSALSKPLSNYASSLKIDPAILDDPVKAFEAFKTQYPKNDAIRDNKVALKRKYDAAKALANEVNDARNQIKALTVQIEKLRKQQAMANEGLLGTRDEDETFSPDSTMATAARADFDTAEQNLKAQIDMHKSAYKKGFNELSELKKEIQHIQKMLEMGRLKLQKEFDLWYQRQGKGALLTETLLAQAKPDAKNAFDIQSVESKPTKFTSEERPERVVCKSTAWDPQLTSKSTSSSARLSTASTVDDDVSEFYEALDILKRRNKTRK
ncbi:kinesin-like protein kif6 [Plasmopara halstedii]|uniref:Kinesin-like protein n=1 Tax=Plasmopara halstedii TaxID=4781 RepID=A0A0P1A8Z2_PLAHL|nr:kinesin-like protein kif6 [Plasmopara halstedii]CEG37054.1 kinesin-like protein kif6 [Plasmopara halstedii]|eukprot:XP_024573423.1 kinesin-like protein kif6 [Plasmopara halstedii]